MVDLKDKFFLITGASSGLGRDLSVELDEKKANLFLTGRNEDELNDTFKSLNGKNHKMFPYDLSDLKNISTLLEEIFSGSIPFDGFVHCAGTHTFLPLNFIKHNEIESAFNVNVFAPFLLIKEFSKKNNFNSDASVVFISSVMAMRGSTSLSLYSSSKAAQVGLVKSLAVELSKKKIRVNSIAASLLASKILDKVKGKTSSESFEEIEKKHLLGLGEYKDIIPSIIHLLSSQSKWITGTNMVIDGGYTSW